MKAFVYGGYLQAPAADVRLFAGFEQLQGFAKDFYRRAVIAGSVQLFAFGAKFLHLRQYARVARWIALQHGVYLCHICRAVHGPQ